MSPKSLAKKKDNFGKKEQRENDTFHNSGDNYDDDNFIVEAVVKEGITIVKTGVTRGKNIINSMRKK